MKQLEKPDAYWTPTMKGQYHLFVGVDLAPNEQLETGVAVLDRENNLLRLEKCYRDGELIGVLDSLIAPANTIVLLDLPKNLGLKSKFRQEELKFYAARLDNPGLTSNERYAERARKLYEALKKRGFKVFMTLTMWSRLNYNLYCPFRSRSNKGSRALQLALVEQLFIQGLPNSMQSFTTLEAAVAAYTAWSLWKSAATENVLFYEDDDGFPVLIGRHVVEKSRERRRFPRMRRITSYRSSRTTASSGTAPAGSSTASATASAKPSSTEATGTTRAATSQTGQMATRSRPRGARPSGSRPGGRRSV